MAKRKRGRLARAARLGFVWLAAAATAAHAQGSTAPSGIVGGSGATLPEDAHDSNRDKARVQLHDSYAYDTSQLPILRDRIILADQPVLSDVPVTARHAGEDHDHGHNTTKDGGKGTGPSHKQLFAEDPGDLCCGACMLTLGAPHFADTSPHANRLDKLCRSRMQTTSVYLCLRVFCHGYHTGRRMAQLNGTCADQAHQALPPYEALASAEMYSDDDVAGLRRLSRAEATDQTSLSGVVVPSQELFDQAWKTLDSYGYVHRNHLLYGALMVFYWVVVIFYGFCFRLFFAVMDNLRRWRRKAKYQPLAAADDDADPEPGYGAREETGIYQTTTWLLNRPRVWVKRYLTVPATFGYRCAQDFGWYTVPPRVQTVAIAVWVVLNVVACCVGYRVFEGNMYWPNLTYQWYRYVSDRTGIISYANFPLIWIFGMRNNVLMFLTGWEFGTFNNFHRWVARVATVQAIIHSIGYTLIVASTGGWTMFALHFKQLYWWTGEVATIVMSFLLLFSFFWFRRHMYEVFLVLHILLSALCLVGMAGHLSIFKGRFDGFLWACSFIWVLDRAMRLSRILAFNPFFWNTKASAYYDPQSNIVRLVVPYTSSWYQPQPGTFYYIQVLNDKRFWESHPFTVSSIATLPKRSWFGQIGQIGQLSQLSQLSQLGRFGRLGRLGRLARLRSSLPLSPAVDQPLAEPDQPLPDNNNHHHHHSNDDADADEASGMLDSSSGSSTDVQRPLDGTAAGDNESASRMTPPGSLTFLIRPYSSFTARLRDKAASLPFPRPTPLRVLIDGPYGHSQRFDDFDSVLFVVGGSGIVVPLTHLTGIAQAKMAASAGRSRLRSVHIVWAAREAAFAADVIRQDFRDLLGPPANPESPGASGTASARAPSTPGLPDVTLDVYITQKTMELVNEDEEDTDGDDDDDDDASSDIVVLPKGPKALRSRLPPQVRIIYSRPDVRGEVDAAIQQTRANRRLAVMACGPGIMADVARQTVVDMLGRKGTGDVEYLEESFQW